LQPFHGNIRKRLTKNSRIYWRDSGLLHSLLGASTMDALLSQPWVGQSWEGFAVEQVLGYLSATGIEAEPCFFRTSDGHEIDLVLDLHGERWAVEVKLSAAPGIGDLERLNKCADLIQAERRVLLSRTRTTVESAKVVCTDLAGLVRLLRPRRR
jgi:uncharacterized protein